MSTPRADRPTIVPPHERVSPAGQHTSGMQREQAFATDDRWIGFVTSDPGEWSGWHHHGTTDTYFYVLQGGIELECEADATPVLVSSGDFCHVPPGLVHRERPQPGARAEIVLVRIGTGPTVVNVIADEADRRASPAGRD